MGELLASIIDLQQHHHPHTSHSHDTSQISIKMSSPQDYMRKLQTLANQARSGGGGPGPKGLAGGVGSLLVLGGLAVVGSNALFNVDGGHRAIKYTRIGGVGKEIYAEGTTCTGELTLNGNLTFYRHTSKDPMVRDTDRLRCSSKATQRCISHRHERFTDGQHYLSCSL